MFELVMGLEVHVQLNTKTKLFCSCSTSFGEKPNQNTCPVCLGLPGSLPKLNKEAVIKAIKFGTSINANINDNSIFERKNYFYPDLPSGYQISQLERPIVETGEFLVNSKEVTKKIRINRAHLETDAGKNTHENNHSLVDLNRSGTPLLEIVTEPDFRRIEEVTLYLKKLQTLVRYLDISDANMQEGSFRCDVNISIRPKGSEELFTRVEIKNMNSFKFIEKAITYESQRQIDAWEDGKYEREIFQETRLFDTEKSITKSMRSKEESSDYRYFPDPDLLEVTLTKEILKEGENIPELPESKFNRYVNELKIKEEDAERIIQDMELNELFEHFLNGGFKHGTIITWVVVEYMGRINKEEYKDRKSSISLHDLSSLMELIEREEISGQGGKKILDYIVTERTNVEEEVFSIVEKLNLTQVSSSNEILPFIEEVLNENNEKVNEYKSGKEKLLGFFVGQVMKKSKGKANPALVSDLIIEKLLVGI